MEELIDFKHLKALNQEYLNSFEHFKSGDFYKAYNSQDQGPSFTNTGIVLQALHETQSTPESQQLAQLIVNNILSHDPGESGSPVFLFDSEDGKAPHLMCNAWLHFSILEIFPIYSCRKEFQNICKWYLKLQNVDGGWDLWHGKKADHSPIWSSYALNVLFQFYDLSIIYGFEIEGLSESIQRATKFLLNERLDKAKEKQLYLWGDGEQDDISVSYPISTMCLHIIIKYADRFENKQIKKKAIETFDYIFRHFRKADIIDTPDFKIFIWGHVRELGGGNYSWTFFAPIHLVTILNILEDFNEDGKKPYYVYMKYMIDWIIKNTILVKDKYKCVKPAVGANKVAAFSTAQACIVFSRVLKNGLKIKELEEDVISIDAAFATDSHSDIEIRNKSIE